MCCILSNGDKLNMRWELYTHIGESRIFSFTKYDVTACVDRSRIEAITERTSSCSEPNTGNQLTRSTLPLERTVS